MEKGSHNLIPFSHTRMVIPQIYLSHVFNENWYTYVNDSLANTMGISTSTIQQFRKIFAVVKENIERNHQQYKEYYLGILNLEELLWHWFTKGSRLIFVHYLVHDQPFNNSIWRSRNLDLVVIILRFENL